MPNLASLEVYILYSLSFDCARGVWSAINTILIIAFWSLCRLYVSVILVYMIFHYYPLFIGIVVGIHGASYGAYKDSPYEGFKLRRVIREILIAGTIGLLFSVYSRAETEEYFIVFLIIFAFSRLITEFYKLFIRVESQDLYKIPTQIHFYGKVVTSKVKRLLLGALPAFFILVIYILGEYGLTKFPTTVKGIVLGLIMGLATATAGSYKDGFFEGFDMYKFLRSPFLGTIGGVLVSQFTSNALFIILCAVGFERLNVEVYKAFLKKGYWPGKFGSGKVRHQDWLKKRKIFIPLYFFTLLYFLLLLFWAFFVHFVKKI